MTANMTAALIGMLFSAGLAAFMIWDVRDGWLKGRFVLRGSSVITRRKQPWQYYFGLVYKLIIIALSLSLLVYASGRLLSWWGPA